jgi:putative membrane protein
MTLGEAAHQHAEGALDRLLLVALTLAVAAGYLLLAARRRHEPRGWSTWRTGAFLTGSALLVLALLPGLTPYGDEDFRGHMLQHLLIGMLGPLGLVLGAPVTLLLRSLPARHGRGIGRVLRSRPAHVLGHPVTALLLNLGGLAALYVTPLYAATGTHPVLHDLVHLHFLVAGYLFAWVIAGPDPAPRRPSVTARLVILGVAVAGHAVLSQLLYAGILVQVAVPAEQLRGGAVFMYYGGDIAELLLAFALMTTWRPRRPTDAHGRLSAVADGSGDAGAMPTAHRVPAGRP